MKQSGILNIQENKMSGQIIENMPVTILLIEDNEDDIFLMNTAFKQTKTDNTHVIRDGASALQFLHKDYTNLPKLILLDLNLPKMNGFEILKQIKTAPALQNVPVIILTSSVDREDVNKAYELYANCYLSKPVGMNQLVKLVNLIKEFWLETAELPINC
jgi:chemotaxis family two-component system response regulator Rcp1